MLDSNKFDEAVQKSGLKKRYLAEQIGMSYDTFLKKTGGVVEWKVGEAQAVSKVLRISVAERNAIFFA